MMDFSAFGLNSGLIEELYAQWRAAPQSVGGGWATYFERLEKEEKIPVPAKQHTGVGQVMPLAERSIDIERLLSLQERVTCLIQAYRESGHYRANINPLTKDIAPMPETKELLSPESRFSPEDLSMEVPCLGFAGNDSMTLSKLLKLLPAVYCSTVGFEYSHLPNREERGWLSRRIECEYVRRGWYEVEQQKVFLRKLIETELFDSELHLRFPNTKRFSLRGAETLNTMLMTLLDYAAVKGCAETVIGMTHRGRINVLGNIAGQSLRSIVAEFEDMDFPSVCGAGDVKYHLGHRSTVRTQSGREIELTVAPNASHLESISPIVEGMVRGCQSLLPQGKKKAVLGVLIHGDAAFSAQGVVTETFNLAQLPGYSTGGTIHIVVNNQVGFTTGSSEGRSSVYCTDFAKGAGVPVFHANSEDIDACSWLMELAYDFRQAFGKDVVLDLYCYRKLGHNEVDDPLFTQPVMYSEINARKSLADMYGSFLVQQELIAESEIHEIERELVDQIAGAMKNPEYQTLGEAKAVYGRIKGAPPVTRVSPSALTTAAKAMVDFPNGFIPHPKIRAIMERRVGSVEAKGSIDFPTAEELALATLTLEGCHVRLSGQDSGRGTFSQRHLELHHLERHEHFQPIARLAEKSGRGRFELYNSPLSEAAVLGFEYGFGVTAPDSLVLWEAQFGDFANNAQVVIDQYLTSSEAKWGQRSGVTLLLPHGYEGQGPEHSSARIERFLTLSAHGNMSVIYPSTASQYFHALRRQGLSVVKRPLVVFTPKSLLRLPEAASLYSEFTEGEFHPLLTEEFGEGDKVEHLVFLTGRIYYQLKETLSHARIKKTLVFRVEELYPFRDHLVRDLARGIEARTCSWLQEEPANMGAFRYIERRLRVLLQRDINYVGRSASGSVAPGSARFHKKEQQQIIDDLVELLQT